MLQGGSVSSKSHATHLHAPSYERLSDPMASLLYLRELPQALAPSGGTPCTSSPSLTAVVVAP